MNFKLYDEWGRVRRRLDLSYPAIRLIVEYDGRQHAEDIEQWSSDLERRGHPGVPRRLSDDWRIHFVPRA